MQENEETDGTETRGISDPNVGQPIEKDEDAEGHAAKPWNRNVPNEGEDAEGHAAKPWSKNQPE